MLEKKVEDAMKKWRFENAIWGMDADAVKYVEDILKNDQTMVEYCSRCAETGMWQYYDELRESILKTLQVIVGIGALGIGIKLTKIFFKK